MDMRLGGQIFGEFVNPDKWLSAVGGMGYRAAFFPVDWTAEGDVIDGCAKLAKEYDILIAEVGAWSNPMSPDAETAKKAIEFCKRQLELAERVGASCCVNIAGSMGETWDGPHKDSFSKGTMEKIVNVTREIIDHVKPSRTSYTLEMMPWMLPEGPETFLDLQKAVCRKAFGAHLDVANIINSPGRYYDTKSLIKECFLKMGPYIKSCHAKDIIMSNKLTVHLDETVPGRGAIDYKTYINCINGLNPDIPLMVEHMATQDDLDEALSYIRKF